MYFAPAFEAKARERLRGWRDWDEVRRLIEWVFKRRLYRAEPVREIDDQYWIQFNLVDQVHRVSTWIFTFELNDERTRQANAIDIRREHP